MTKRNPPPPDRGEFPLIEALPPVYSALMSEILEMQRLHAFSETGNGALFWRAYQARRAGGATSFDENWLRILDAVVADLLAARTNDEVAAAVLMDRPSRGGPGDVASESAALDAHAIAQFMWLEHARRSGVGRSEDELRRFFEQGPPDRLKPGVIQAAAQYFETVSSGRRPRSLAALKQVWQRYKARWRESSEAERREAVAGAFRSWWSKGNAGA